MAEPPLWYQSGGSAAALLDYFFPSIARRNASAIALSPSFASLRSFFEQLAHYQRIVSISNFQIKQVDNQTSMKTVDATFDLTAYYVSAEKLNSPAAQPAGSGQVPPAAAPPKK